MFIFGITVALYFKTTSPNFLSGVVSIVAAGSTGILFQYILQKLLQYILRIPDLRYLIFLQSISHLAVKRWEEPNNVKLNNFCQTEYKNNYCLRYLKRVAMFSKKNTKSDNKLDLVLCAADQKV